MTLDEYITKIQGQSSSLKSNLVAALDESAPATHSDQVLPRIFEKGLNPELGKIGDYASDKYKEKRRKKGLQVAFIDMKFTGDLKSEFSKPTRRVTGKTPSISFNVLTAENKEKVVENEKRRGTIFGLSAPEKQYFVDLLTRTFFAKVFK